jgi:hypothetical protein
MLESFILLVLPMISLDLQGTNGRFGFEQKYPTHVAKLRVDWQTSDEEININELGPLRLLPKARFRTKFLQERHEALNLARTMLRKVSKSCIQQGVRLSK